MPLSWTEIARTLEGIAKAGLTYSENPYDRERYEQLMDLTLNIIKQHGDIDEETLTFIAREEGYLTPKVDIRAVIFEGNEILLVKEKFDNANIGS